MHRNGPYNNLKDRFVQSFVGLPLFTLYDDHVCNNIQISSTVPDVTISDETCKKVRAHQSEDGEESLPVTCVNKSLQFDYTLGFVTTPSLPFITSHSSPIDMNDGQAYLALVSDVLSSGLPNYRSVRVPLPSVFNWDYLQRHVSSYHDGRLLDYIKFGVPLGISNRKQIVSNATENHHSALAYPVEIDAFFEK